MKKTMMPEDELRELLEMERGTTFAFKLLEAAEKYPLDSKILDLVGAELWSGVFDDVVSTQMRGWGASNFLVHQKETHFQVVAEFRSGSGNMFDRYYAAHVLRTWHLLAAEVLRLREQLGEETKTPREPMSRKELQEKHPDLKYLEFDSGWNELMDRIATEFEKIREECPEFKLTGGKQKYAALEIFVMNTDGSGGVFGNPRITALREKARDLSHRICESCGAPGVWRNLSWEQVLCSDCYNPEDDLDYVDDEEFEPVDWDTEFGSEG